MTPEEEKAQADRLEQDKADRKKLDEDQLKELADKAKEANSREPSLENDN